MNLFEQLGLNELLLKAVQDLGFEKPSEVQEKAIPLLLEQDTDIVALAQTGTGKTAAFGFPLIQKIDPESSSTQALILAPTRELCLQITNEIKLYAKYVKGVNTVAVYGGASIQEQAREIKRGAQIIVATPGRMQDMINRKLVNIRDIQYCVLDEADEMLNMGFYEDMVSILSETPAEKNTWLFSATMPAEVARIAREFMVSPQEITVGAKNAGSATISHEFYLVNARERYEALKRLADANPDIFSVVFCRTKRDTQQIAEKLIEDGYNAAALHGDLSQAQRDTVMKSFRNRQIRMLVATDVAARGIDVNDVTHVINYQLPDEVETYTHRSGRTGRAGKLGTSIVIVTKSELRKIHAIEKIIKQKFEEKSIPSGMEICEIQLFHLASQVKDVEVDHEIESYLPAIYELLKDLSKEEIIKKMVSVEFNRFLNYYKKKRDIVAEDGGKREKTTSYGGGVRYFVNIGARDNFNWMTLKDFLRDTLEVGRDDVYKVDVKEDFSFFNTDEQHTERVMEVLNNLRIEGRKINVEISKNDSRDFKGGRDGFKKGGFKGDGFRKDFKKDGFRKERSFDDKPKDRERKKFTKDEVFGQRTVAPRRSQASEPTREASPRREGSPRRMNDGFEKAPRRSSAANDAPRSRRPRKG